MDKVDWLIIGLGNPEQQYQSTRHNLGWMVIDVLCKQWSIKLSNSQDSLVSLPVTIKPPNQSNNISKIVVLKPLTYVNNSGVAVKKYVDKCQITSKEAIVIYDDFALPLGQIRIKPNGSAGGHNGLESIIALVGTQDFPRIRLGIGPVPQNVVTKEFVLSEFNQSEIEQAKVMINTAVETVETVLFEGLNKAMNIYNRKPDVKDDDKNNLKN